MEPYVLRLLNDFSNSFGSFLSGAFPPGQIRHYDVDHVDMVVIMYLSWEFEEFRFVERESNFKNSSVAQEHRFRLPEEGSNSF